ncbi:MAG TPA: hypothetical protein VMZ25_01625 [Terriglobales bacterium]|nr:hypothetical protein [Terriglobales bacterium]
MSWIKYLFYICGFYGLLVIAALYFRERAIAAAGLPGITYPEFFYGFIGVGLAWQLAFLVIGGDPLRYRPLILVAVIEKIGFGLPAALLYKAGRIPAEMFAAGMLDLLMAVLFTIAWVQLGKAASSSPAAA